MPMDPEDDCFFENNTFIAAGENGPETFQPEIQTAGWWVEDHLGRPAEEGIVKMEYPEGFFGKENGGS